MRFCMYLWVYNLLKTFHVTGGGIDYNSGPYTLIFPIESTNVSFDIIISNDTILEGDEKFNVSIDSIVNGHIVFKFIWKAQYNT